MPAGRRNLKNNWSTTLQADAAAAATTLSLPQAWIDKLTAPNPSSTQWYELTLDDGAQAPEIVRCTGKGTGTVTVVRAQQGTTAPTTWATGTVVEIRVTAELARVLEFASWDANNNWTMGELAGGDLSTGQNNWLLGRSAGRWLTTGGTNTALGGFALDGPETGSRNLAAGYQAASGAGASASDLVALGYQAGLNAGAAQRSVYVGSAAQGPFSDSIVIGNGAIVYTANTAVLGSASSRLSEVYIGGGQRDSAAAQVTLSASAGSGTNKAGGTLRLGGGKGTGTGAGGKVIIATAPTGGVSGTTEAAWTDRAEWDNTGLFWTYAGLKTGDPGLGAGTWKLGTVQAGAVALDTANYVEVDIGGTVVKLLKAA